MGTKVKGRDLIGLIQREQARYLSRFANESLTDTQRAHARSTANELSYILGRCTAHAAHIRSIEESGD